MPEIHIVVLAAGKGTRMKSAVPKVLHQVCGLPMIEHVLRSGDALRPASTTVVVGHGADLVRDKLATRPSVSLVVQEPQLGTGHALLQAEQALGRTSRNAGGAVRRRSASQTWHARAPGRHPYSKGRSRNGSHGDVWPIPPGTDESSGRMAPSCRSSSIETRARRSAGSAKSTAASTLSISSRCSRRYAPSAPRTRRGSITCRTSSACIASAGSASRRWFSTIPPRFSASTAAVSWRSSRRTSAIARTKSSWPRASPSSIPRERGSNRTFPWGRTAFCIPASTCKGGPPSARGASSSPACVSWTACSETTCS